MIVFQCKESLQRGMSSLILLTLYMLQKRAPWTTYLLESTNRHLACRALVWHIRDMGNAWTWQRMCPRSFFFFLKNDGHGRTQLGHGLCYQKNKICNTISHTNLLPLPLTLISSAANLLPIPIFSSSPLALSISLLQFPPLPLFLFCSCLFSLFLLLLFFLFHTITHVELFYLQPSTWTKDV